jgi:hypothetical protein
MADDRRRRFLPANSEVKEDLQEIYASTEAAYLDIRDILSITNDMEKALEKLQSMLSAYTENSSDNMEDGDEKLNQIIQFCSSISDSFERLVETLSTESETQIEETRKNRSILSGVAGTYKTIYNQLVAIKASLDEAMADRRKIDVTLKEAMAKIDLIYTALQAHSPIILFFKNMKDDEVLRLLPTLQIAIAELLKERGFNPLTGEKKEPIIILSNLILSQIKTNFIGILASLMMMLLVNSWLSSTNKTVTTTQKVELDEVRGKLSTLEEANKRLLEELKQKSQLKRVPTK